MTTRRVLVTGGSGFIGRHVVRLLQERGDHVRILDIAEPAGDYGGEFIKGSICEPGVVGRALRGMEEIYHLAANANLWARDKRTFDRTNHQGTRVVLDQARRHDPERIVYTSTESILVGQRHRSRRVSFVDESTSPALEKMPGPYCRSKFLAEQAAWEAARRDQPVVVVSPTMPIGPGDENLTPPTKMILGFLTGATPAYLNCGLNLVDVRDAAKGHLLAADKGRVGQRYILSGGNIMLADLLTMLYDITGVPQPRVRVPYWLALCASMTSELIADYVTHRPPMAPVTGVRLVAEPMFFDNSQTVAELGYHARPVRQALTDAIRWMHESGLLAGTRRH